MINVIPVRGFWERIEADTERRPGCVAVHREHRNQDVLKRNGVNKRNAT